MDQLLQEKKLLGEQCASIIKEMEEKHKKMVASMESRHEVELKKLQEKMLAGEKLRREKWENERIKKIKVRFIFLQCMYILLFKFAFMFNVFVTASHNNYAVIITALILMMTNYKKYY